jgi:transcription initiation factor IIE alpha subunit
MKRISLRTIKNKRWLLDRSTKIFRIEEAKEFIERLGFVSALSNGHLPTLSKAIYTDDLPNKFEADQRVWDFLHVLITKKWVYYGRMLGPNNTVVSMKLLPSFIRLYPIPDYRVLYEQGALGDMAKSVMDLLSEQGPLMTHQISSQLEISSQPTKRILRQALLELQRRLLICCAGKIARCKSRWRFGVWAPVDKWVPQAVKTKAKLLSDGEAKCRIIEKYIYTTARTTPKAIARFFNLPLREVREVVSSMIDKELVSSYNHQGEEYLFKGNL